MAHQGGGFEMNSQPTSKHTGWQSSGSSAPRSEARAILFLLASVEASLHVHVPDDGCLDVLKTCMLRIQKRYRLEDHDLSDAIV
jgi:hypothetical protein